MCTHTETDTEDNVQPTSGTFAYSLFAGEENIKTEMEIESYNLEMVSSAASQSAEQFRNSPINSLRGGQPAVRRHDKKRTFVLFLEMCRLSKLISYC